MKVRTFQDKDVYNKKVFLRLDFDVPIVGGEITDDLRLRAGLLSINYLLKNNCFLVLAGHLGRPDHNLENNYKLSLSTVAKWFKKELQIKDSEFKKDKLKEFDGWSLGSKIFLLENLRFNKGEEENDFEFSKSLASIAEVYVNDAFAVSHRNHASITGITKFLPSFAGLRLTKEIEVLSEVLDKPKRPLVVLIGGAKIETKLPVVEKMHQIADYILVGGEIADQDKVLLKVQHEKVIGRKPVLLVADIKEDKRDITKKSAENFCQVIFQGKTIIWNGPMGLISDSKKVYSKATKLIAEKITETDSFSIVGGGDTVGYLNKINLLNKFSFVSTGGGAMLDFLAGEKLPGVEVLRK
ncbi:MAG TPA: phosphoglycerate kinase [Patescibacteria group bacterium]|nr:phosphoglycerate kinase [Patescibacteria group bacterium]